MTRADLYYHLWSLEMCVRSPVHFFFLVCVCVFVWRSIVMYLPNFGLFDFHG